MSDKNSFILYTEYHEQMDMLNNEQAGQLLKAIFAYAAGNEPEVSDPMAAMLWSIMKRRMDIDNEKYQRQCAAKRSNGAKGGRPSKNSAEKTEAEPEAKTEKPNETYENLEKHDTCNMTHDTDTETCNMKHETEKEKEKNKTVSGFVPPSWSDVSGYIFDKGLNVSADKFMEYYTANGWMVGKQPMKDWRMTLRNWDKHEQNGGKGKGISKNKSGKGANSHDHPRYGAEQSTNPKQGAYAQTAGNERYGSGLGEWY